MKSDAAVDGQDIAIVGMTGRFPGAQDLQTFWQNLRQGVESIRAVGDAELEKLGVEPALRQDPHWVKATAALEGMELFDAGFFGFTPREAELMDPQHRVFLECCWEALEKAGYSPEQLPASVGVFAGASTNTYLLYNLVSNVELLSALDQVQIDVGNGADFLSTRVAYKLNLRGPSYTIASACSTSLVATHAACQSLLDEECDLALAGGVSIHVKHPEGYRYLEGGIVSPDGHCRAFDAQANGTVFGSGAGVVVLKRLADALEDGDHIHAVIKGSAINNDGALKVGYTAPGVEGQAAVVREALGAAGVKPDTIGYVETHGTGTKMGDPIEVRALARAFRVKPGAGQPRVPIGSLKSNIGHLANAAGVASLIKAVLALEHRELPPTLHCEQPNPEIDFASGPFYVNTRLAPWPEGPRSPRRAGVSSFGVGGTNAHVVLQQAPEPGPMGAARAAQMLVLSARTPAALDAATENLTRHLKAHPEQRLADVAFTLQVGRQAMERRRVLVCRDREDALRTLESRDSPRVWSEAVTAQDRPVAFLFPELGAQAVNVTRELASSERVFRETLDSCAALLQPHLGIDLRLVLSPEPGHEAEATRTLSRTSLAQPALFALEYALAQLWISWGVRPRAMLGHGLGEYVAACLSGIFPLPDALALVATRGKLMESIPEGGRLDPILAAFTERVRQVKLSAPGIPLLSSVTGTWLDGKQATDPAYWARHLGQAGRVETGLETLLQQPRQALLEVGPGTALGTLAARRAGPDQPVFASLHAPRDQASALEALLGAAGRLWLSGVTLDWRGVHAGEQRRRVPLPTYPFERQRYWIDARPLGSGRRVETATAEKRPELADWFYVPSWKRAPLPRAAREAPLEPGRGFVLFADEGGVADALAAHLSRAGTRAIRVVPGQEYGRRADGAYVLRPGRREDYASLLQAIQAEGQTLDGVVHLWGMAPEPPSLERALDTGFYSLLFLAQALEAQGRTAPLPWWVAANDVLKVESADALAPERATILGPCLVVPQEAPHITCRFVDLSPGDSAAAAEQLLAELQSGAPDAVVAYRGRQRWARTFEPLRLEASAAFDTAPRMDGAYLITDGLAGIGWVLASDLARTRRARLALVEGADFPAKDGWARWLASHGSEDGISLRIRNAQALEAEGTALLVLSASPADEAGMRGAVEQAVARFSQLNGVIHASGGLHGAALKLIQETTPEDCARYFAPQVHGLAVLEKVLPAEGLDFCLLVSSLSSVLGGLGQVAYAAASHFMDSFAERRSGTGRCPWISVSWDAWRFDGAAALSPALARFAMLPAEGLEAARRILAQAEGGQIAVSTGALEARRAEGRSGPARADAGKQGAARLNHPRPQLPTPYVAPRDDTERALAELWQQVLGVEPIGVDDNFFDLGGSSLIAVQASARLKQVLQVDIPAATLYQRPTVRTLGELVARGGDDAHRERADKLARRKEELSQRNQWLHRRQR